MSVSMRRLAALWVYKLVVLHHREWLVKMAQKAQSRLRRTASGSVAAFEVSEAQAWLSCG
jgi:hypothetical protein